MGGLSGPCLDTVLVTVDPSANFEVLPTADSMAIRFVHLSAPHSYYL